MMKATAGVVSQRQDYTDLKSFNCGNLPYLVIVRYSQSKFDKKLLITWTFREHERKDGDHGPELSSV